MAVRAAMDAGTDERRGRAAAARLALLLAVAAAGAALSTLSAARAEAQALPAPEPAPEPAAAPAARRAELIGYDLLALPGEPVQARFKVERPGLARPDVRGAAVEMMLCRDRGGGRDDRREGEGGGEGEARAAWEPLGEATSGRDGYADLALAAPDEIGDHWVAGRAVGAYESPWQYLYLGVRAKGARVIVTDIDGTICSRGVADLAGLALGSVRARPIAGAPLGVADLAAGCTVVYLTARDDAFRATTLRWLDRWSFPLGALYASDGIELGQDPTRYKTAVLEALAERFEVVAGFGDASTDLAAYRAAGVPAILIGAEAARFAGAPGAAGAYRDWEALREAVRGGQHREVLGWAERLRAAPAR